MMFNRAVLMVFLQAEKFYYHLLHDVDALWSYSHQEMQDPDIS